MRQSQELIESLIVSQIKRLNALRGVVQKRRVLLLTRNLELLVEGGGGGEHSCAGGGAHQLYFYRQNSPGGGQMFKRPKYPKPLLDSPFQG